MRTTVTLDAKLVRELVEFTDAKTKTAAVAIAVKEQIRRAKLKKLADFLISKQKGDGHWARGWNPRTGAELADDGWVGDQVAQQGYRGV